MRRRLARVLIAVILAFAATMPAGARAMAVQPGPMATGTYLCGQCPSHPLPVPASGKMAPCPMLACAGPLLAVPAADLTGDRIVQRVTYPVRSPDRVAEATPVPDPFPPRSLVLP
jgi:hypothetical protein